MKKLLNWSFVHAPWKSESEAKSLMILKSDGLY